MSAPSETAKRRQSSLDAHDKDENEPLRYSSDFRGPVAKRSCTDIVCLFVFAISMAIWGIIGLIAYSKGNIDSFLRPRDYQENICGVDEAVKDKPYLFYFNPDLCFPHASAGCKYVCVEKCPTQNWDYDAKTGLKDVELERNNLICDATINKTAITNRAQIDEFMKKENCTRSYTSSDSVSYRCILMQKESNSTSDKISQELTVLDTLTSIAQKFIEDILNTRLEIGVFLIFAMLVCLVFIVVMRWLAGPIVWLVLCGTTVLLGGACYYSFNKYTKLRDMKPIASDKRFLQYILTMNADKILSNKDLWIVLAVFSGILCIVVFLLVLFLRKRIQIAIALIKEGSKAVSAAKITIFFPVIPWALQILTIAFGIFVAVSLASIGGPVHRLNGLRESTSCICPNSYQDGEICELELFQKECYFNGSKSMPGSPVNGSTCQDVYCEFAGNENPPYIQYFQAANLFGFIWLAFFIKGLGDMMLASTFATWYWTFKKSDVPMFTFVAGVYQTLRYHMGTVAFGALIITICRVIRIALEVADRYLKKYDNKFTRLMLSAMKCFFWCMEKFLKFVNRNAFIMCAIHGKHFCSSAQDAFNLLLRNCLRVLAVDKVTDWLFYVAKVFISAVMAYGCYAFTSSEYLQTPVHYVYGPSIIIFFGSYFIAGTFFSVYSMAVDTLFLCFLEDSERNDGSPEKPYYMSKQLLAILGKKNKLAKSKDQT